MGGLFKLFEKYAGLKKKKEGLFTALQHKSEH
jgi:hypothetical protein